MNRKDVIVSEFKSFYKNVGGNEGGKCRYNIRLDTYGCGCEHNCDYCYARSLLFFRGLWDAENPRVADPEKIKRKISQLTPGTILRMGGMTDCFQPCERLQKVTYQTIQNLNHYKIGYLIVTKSAMVAEDGYVKILDKELAHIQITVTCLDNVKAATYEKASPPSKRIEAILKLQQLGYDVSIRLSPLIEEFMDFERLNGLGIERCVVEFLRTNTWIKQWLEGVSPDNYTLRQSGYYHLPLEEKIRILEKIHIPMKTVCEDVTNHYEYWKRHVNPNQDDCCNLRI